VPAPDARWQPGDVVLMRYVTPDERIDFAWPYRVVEDTGDQVALFIARGSAFRADPKRTARQKITDARRPEPVHEGVWRRDTLRLMWPGASHSVWLSWEGEGASRRLRQYFVNLEEPFRRTPAGFDSFDHCLDVEVTPELECVWRDEEDFQDHLSLGFYTPELAEAVRAEGQRVIDEIASRTHPCLRGWATWSPPSEWSALAVPATWNTTPLTIWERRRWAYGPANLPSAAPHSAASGALGA
jgi:uncharacterized protein